jgi:hypothetical protein
LEEDFMGSQSSSRTKRILYILVVIAVLLLVVAAGVLIGRQLSGRDSDAQNVVVPSATIEVTKPTAVLATVEPKRTTPPRAAVPGGRVDTPTGIGILPPVQLAGGRRYVLQINSADGEVDFFGSYSRGSLDPKIAVDVMKEIKGRTPWEQQVEPPAPGSRTWTLGVTASSVPVGKNLSIVILDVGPK